ncbi:Mediator of RNA polymerase II transcription subunit [Dirofilaria immitis]
MYRIRNGNGWIGKIGKSEISISFHICHALGGLCDNIDLPESFKALLRIPAFDRSLLIPNQVLFVQSYFRHRKQSDYYDD